MPIIAQQLVIINANDDLSIHILDEISNCGCIQSKLLSTRLNTPLKQLKNTLAHIAKNGTLKCDANFEICCADKTTFDKFTNALKRLSDSE